eukprot:TRINITY_DN1047_c0_g1_i1.p1 TRINITY_DN1047_c0_g1~~TRINITY_DN1047_c0_g1_i1.p1  ORF type:complete len:1216 (-),score=236.63 TRINITY_DN1047_c0_g1_i1:224-3871(-)
MSADESQDHSAEQVQQPSNDDATGDLDDDTFPLVVQCPTGSAIHLQVSPAETVLEIRQIICETVEGCYVTSFQLVVDKPGSKGKGKGKPDEDDVIVLDDFQEIREQEGIQPGAVVRMRFVRYDDKGVRQHVSRFADLVYAPLSDIYLASACVVPGTGSAADPSYPSFLHLLPEKADGKRDPEKSQDPTLNSTFHDLQYALDVDGDITPFTSKLLVTKGAKKPATTPAAPAAPAQAKGKSKKDGKSSQASIPAAAQAPAGATSTAESVTANLETQLDGPEPLAFVRALVQANNSNHRLPAPLRSLRYSGWNPVPSNRRLQGDLYYLEVVLLNGTLLYITASTTGFFVNRTTDSTTLRPEIHGEHKRKSVTLLGLLYNIDSEFAARMDYIVRIRALLHPFEATSVSTPHARPWLADPSQTMEEYVYNNHRAEAAYTAAFQPPEPRAPTREWNEEMQGSRDLPSNTLEEKLIRERTIHKVHADFLDAAQRGAIAVVNRQLGPINPMDPELHHVFMWNNIFFSYAADVRGIYKEMGGDHAAYVLAKQDLHGLRMVADADIKAVLTIDTVVVDYKGRRVICQAILPGILQGEQEHKHQYGAMDNSKDMKWDEEFHQQFSKVAEALHLKVHKIANGEGKVYDVALPCDCKGIRGADNRLYMLELIRFTPRDANFKDRPTACVRPELMHYFFNKQQDGEIRDAEHLMRQKSCQFRADGSKPAISEVDGEGDSDVQSIRFNPDILTHHNLADDAEALAEDTRNAETLAALLTEKQIPQLVKELVNLEVTVTESVALTAHFHGRGVNMRYLGAAAQACPEKAQFVRRLLIQEMIARVCKHRVRRVMADSLKEEESFAGNIASLLNQIFGQEKEGAKDEAEELTEEGTQQTANKKKKKKANKSHGISEEIAVAVKKAYNYDLPTSWWELFTKLSLLRSICVKTGLRLRCREFDFTQPRPFSASDVIDASPIVAHVPPKCKTGNEMMADAVKAYSASDWERAYQCMGQALAIFHQVLGPMCKEVAVCFSQLSALLCCINDMEGALLHQHKAMLISRRILGFDHSFTTHLLQYMGLLCHATQKHETALQFFKRAYYMHRLVAGFEHPDACISLANIGLMHQEMGDHFLAVDRLSRALRLSEEMIGAPHVQFLACNHAIAVSLSQLRDYKGAVVHQKKVYELTRSHYGADSPLTQDADRFLSTLLHIAVQQKKSEMGTPAIAAKPSKR